MGGIGSSGAIGRLSPFIVGSSSKVADHPQEWVEDTDIGGVIAHAITPGTFRGHGRVRDRGAAAPRGFPGGAHQAEPAPHAWERGDQLPEKHPGSGLRYRAAAQA